MPTVAPYHNKFQLTMYTKCGPLYLIVTTPRYDVRGIPAYTAKALAKCDSTQEILELAYHCGVSLQCFLHGQE